MKRRQRQFLLSPLEAATLKLGIDELYCRLHWFLRDRPRTLSRWRREYRQYGLRLQRAIERASGVRP